MQKYDITGMSCAACSAKVEKAVKKVKGVTSCNVNLLTNSMVVDGNANENTIIDAVKKAGYGAKIKGKTQKIEEKTQNNELKSYIYRIFGSVLLLIVLLYFSMGYNMWNFPVPSFFDENYIALSLLQMILATLIILINKEIFIDGFKGIFKGNVNMFTLVGLGSGIAYIYSIVIFFIMTGESRVQSLYHNLYFESSAMILTLITLGKLLETYSKGKTTNAIKSLLNLAPKTARVIRNKEEVEINIDEIVVGDIFIVRPGESIAVDAVVIDGSSTVDESMLTGESLPIEKNIESSVFAGTINLNSTLTLQATKIGNETMLSKIIQLVSDATATKAPVARVADKVSAIFVPVVLCLSLITFIVWLCTGQTVGYALARAISVLVISCPCALGLATPVAIMVGTGKGAKNGILFKAAKSLEITSKTQIIVLDKTGTITTGKMGVFDIIAEDDDNLRLIQLVYTLEYNSNHPLANAIKDHALKNNIEKLQINNFEEISGKGITANIDNKKALCGNYEFIKKYINIPEKFYNLAKKLANEGKTVIFSAYHDKFLGMIAISDTIRLTSKEAIKKLKDMGLYVVMLTGDNKLTANNIAKEVGVDEVVAEVLPDEKEAIIRTLQKFGKVAMVGDGINDSPALAKADIGIAIGAGSDIAIESADVVLERNDLNDVAATLKLSRSTLLNIYENLFWAFIYNIIGIPLAAGVFIPIFGWELNPMFGALAMSLSSVCVVLNALRLNIVNIHKTSHIKIKNKFKNQKLLEKKENEMKTLILNVNGMMCVHCEMTVSNALKKIDGVVDAVADHESKKVTITLNKNVDISLLKQAIINCGYEVID